MSGGSSAVILSGCLVEVDVEVCGDARFFRLAKGEVEIDSDKLTVDRVGVVTSQKRRICVKVLEKSNSKSITATS